MVAAATVIAAAALALELWPLEANAQPGGGGRATGCEALELKRTLYSWTDDDALHATFVQRVGEGEAYWTRQQSGCRPRAIRFQVERYAEGRFCFSWLRVFCARPDGFRVRLRPSPYASKSNMRAAEGDWDAADQPKVNHELGHVLNLADNYDVATRRPDGEHAGHLMAQLDGAVAEHETRCACSLLLQACQSSDPRCHAP